MNGNRIERGQALVLIVLAIVAMFGFAALAVDFGRLYAERRRVQSAADAAALAAALAAGQEQDYEAAAFSQLRLNDVFDMDPIRNEGTRVDVEIYHPPISGAYGPASGRSEDERNRYYQVIIHSAVDQVFSQFVYQGPLQLTVEAVAHVRTASGVFAGDVLHATTRTECQGLKFHGTATTHLIGGNAFSDSGANGDGGCESLDDGGGSSCVSGVLDGTGTVWVEGGEITTAGSWVQNGGSGELLPPGLPVNECQPAQDLPYIPLPDCSHLPNREYTGQRTIDEGIYEDGIIVHGRNTVLELNPGMYCLNGDLLMNGGTITGQGVMIYMRGGSVQLGGNTSVNLMAAGGTSLKDARGQEWSGMLIYMPSDNDGVVHIGGGSGSRYSGTIYAPGPRTPFTGSPLLTTGRANKR